MAFQVIGEDGELYYMDGDVGSVMGDYDDYEVGRSHRRHHRRHHGRHHHGGHSVRVHKPDWRERQLAPGVQAPDQGLLPLPLSPQTNNGIFTAAIPSITFQGQMQKPFRGERVLVSTVRTGTSAVGRLVSQLFVGTDLQQADVPGFDIEQIGDVQGFGIRLTMLPAQPGVFIRILSTLSTVLTTTDTIAANMQILGRIVH